MAWIFFSWGALFAPNSLLPKSHYIYNSFNAWSLISILHERHPLAHPTRIRWNRQFAAAIRDKCVISRNGDGWSQRSAKLGYQQGTYILVKRAISSVETDGLMFFSTRRSCSSRISC